MSDVPLLVAPCSHKAAAFANKNWHYSAHLPVSKLVEYGVWEYGEFIGAVVFGAGAAPKLGHRYDLTGLEVAELVRVALGPHKHPVSQIVPQAVQQLHATQPGLRLLISFADTAKGHTGFIYQAMNWIYLGETAPVDVFMDRHGNQFHNRYVSKTGTKVVFGKVGKVPKHTEMAKIIRTPHKYRYGWPLDKAMRRKLAPMALPYPTGLT